MEQEKIRAGRNGSSTGDQRRRHHHPVNEKNLLAASLLNLVVSILEFAGGVLSGSVALLSASLHNLSDTFAGFIAFMATMAGKKSAPRKRIFSYKRLEILAALLNAVILIVVSVFLLREAWDRWNDPHPINSLVMIVVAMIGLLANLYAVIILRKDSRKSIHVRATFRHLVGDTISSIVVIGGGILIQLFGFLWIDPLLTLLISIYIFREAFVILKESADMLIQPAPENLDLQRIKRRMEQTVSVRDIPHLQAWMLNDRQIHLEAHIELNEDLKLSEVNHTRKEIEQALRDEFHISRITIQFQYGTRSASRIFHHKEYT